MHALTEHSIQNRHSKTLKVLHLNMVLSWGVEADKICPPFVIWSLIKPKKPSGGAIMQKYKSENYVIHKYYTLESLEALILKKKHSETNIDHESWYVMIPPGLITTPWLLTPRILRQVSDFPQHAGMVDSCKLSQQPLIFLRAVAYLHTHPWAKKTYCIVEHPEQSTSKIFGQKCKKTDISTKSLLFTHSRHTSTLVFPISSFQPYARWLVHRNWPRVPVDFHLSMPHSQSQRVFHVHGAPVAKKPGKSKVGIVISQDGY